MKFLYIVEFIEVADKLPKPGHRSNKKADMDGKHSVGALVTCGKAFTTVIEVNFRGIIALLLCYYYATKTKSRIIR